MGDAPDADDSCIVVLYARHALGVMGGRWVMGGRGVGGDIYLDSFVGGAANDPRVVELYARHALGVTLERAHVTPPAQPVVT